MDFRGWIPLEAWIILALVVIVAGFIGWDFIIPFVSHHIAFH